LRERNISKLREVALLKLKKILHKKRYDEIYINLGKNIMKSLEEFEKAVPESTKITYAQGRGIGPKMTHTKAWIESQIRRD
jgi:hypothetical protein